MDVALHERPPVVVLDVAVPPLAVHCDLFRETLRGNALRISLRLINLRCTVVCARLT